MNNKYIVVRGSDGEVINTIDVNPAMMPEGELDWAGALVKAIQEDGLIFYASDTISFETE